VLHPPPAADLGESGHVRRAIVTLVALALLSTTGCTSVTPTVDPDHLPPRQPLAPAGGEAPSPVASRPPAVQPSARDALVKSSTGKPKAKKSTKAKQKKTQPPHRTKPAVVDHERPAPAPPPRPVHRAPAPPRPAAQRPERRPAPVAPRPARPRQTYDGRVACQMATGVADPALVSLCRKQFGR
jgi:hypothetical protein